MMLGSLLVRRRGAGQIIESVVTLPISFRMVGAILDFLIKKSSNMLLQYLHAK